jgi:hypothetical protein
MGRIIESWRFRMDLLRKNLVGALVFQYIDINAVLVGYGMEAMSLIEL